MKNTVLLITALFSFGIFCQAQSVNQDLKSLYGVVEATWCGNCGQYGIPTTNSLLNTVGHKAVYMTLHKSNASDLHSADADTLAQALNNPSGQPSWSLNGISEGSYNASLVQNLTNKINTYYDSNNAIVNTNGTFTVTNSSIEYDINAEFFKNGNNQDYYLQLYVMENDITAYQSNYDPNITSGNIQHHHILRKAVFSNGAYGNLIADGASATQGYIQNFNASFPLDSSWDKSNVYLAAVIWQYDSTNYTYYNAQDVFTNVPTAVKDVAKNDVVLYPNPVKNNLHIRTKPGSFINSVRIWNTLGQQLNSFDFSDKHTNNYLIDTRSLPTYGQFILKIETDKGVYYEQITK